MSDVITRAVALAEAPRPPMDMAMIDAVIRKAKAQMKNMYGFEGAAKNAIYARINELEILKLEPQFADYRRFATLDMLKWRDRNGYPNIALFSLDSPRFEIKVSWIDDKGGEPRQIAHLPHHLRDCYNDVIGWMWKKCKSEWTRISSATLSCEYKGVIPSEARDKIKKAVEAFGKDSVFIMAEGTDWAYRTEPRPVLSDPLVVGWDGGNLWLVDQFDLTPVERLIASEFTL